MGESVKFVVWDVGYGDFLGLITDGDGRELYRTGKYYDSHRSCFEQLMAMWEKPNGDLLAFRQRARP